MIDSFAPSSDSLSIDCDTCVQHDTSACDDCVVSFIVSREPNEAVVIDAASFAALRRLSDAGLVPELRHHETRTASGQ